MRSGTSKLALRKQLSGQSIKNLDGSDVASGNQIPNQVYQAMVEENTHEGPLPSSSELQGYDTVLPGAADRIISMLESNVAHVQEMEKTHLASHFDTKQLQLKLGAGTVLLVFLVTALALILGHEKAAIAFGTTTVIALATIFVSGKRYSKQESKEENNKD